MVPLLTNLVSNFAAVNCAAKPTFLGLEPWYQYIPMQQVNGMCQITKFQLLGANSSLVLILMAIVDDLLRLAGLLAVIFIIYAGIKYITSSGSPDKTSAAQSTIMNALIGLSLALISIRFVSFIANKLAGGAPNGGTTAVGLNTSSLPVIGMNGSGNTFVGNALSIVFAIVGSIALLFVVLGGVRYVTSRGDPQATAKAKSTIIYALVGVVIVIVAQSIVSFVINSLHL